MPERYFDVQWPDGSEESCYSPSSVIENYLTAGECYSLPQFLSLADSALSEASDRVKGKYGYYCSSAMDQMKKINHRAAQFEEIPDASVTVKRIHSAR